MNYPFRVTRSFVGLLISLLPLIVAPGCSGKKTGSDEDEAESSNVPALVSVETATVIKTDLATAVAVTGKIDATRRQRLFAPVSGTVIAFPHLEGEFVKAGTVLAEIRTKESQSAINGAESILRSATTDAMRQEAKRDLQLAQSSQTALTLKASFDGVLSNRMTGPGELVSENTEMVTLVDLTSMFFNADVPLTILSTIHVGQRCSIGFPSLPGTAIEGIVRGIGGQSDQQTQTVKVRIEFSSLSSEQCAGLKTDMSGTARITTAIHKGILAVPRSAVIRDDEKQTSEVVAVRDGIAIRIPVQTGIRSDSLIEISGSGVAESNAVVTTGASTLPDSTHVHISSRVE